MRSQFGSFRVLVLAVGCLSVFALVTEEDVTVPSPHVSGSGLKSGLTKFPLDVEVPRIGVFVGTWNWAIDTFVLKRLGMHVRSRLKHCMNEYDFIRIVVDVTNMRKPYLEHTCLICSH